MAPLVFRAPEVPAVGPAAVCAGGRRPAREIATREPEGSEWSISKPGQAPPPPTGTAARPSGPSGALYTGVTSAIASQFRMQFPDACRLWPHRKLGISTIAC